MLGLPGNTKRPGARTRRAQFGIAERAFPGLRLVLAREAGAGVRLDQFALHGPGEEGADPRADHLGLVHRTAGAHRIEHGHDVAPAHVGELQARQFPDQLAGVALDGVGPFQARAHALREVVGEGLGHGRRAAALHGLRARGVAPLTPLVEGVDTGRELRAGRSGRGARVCLSPNDFE